MNNELMKKGSLQQYLLRRLGAIVLCLALLLGGLFSYLLLYSHDDSAEYYMQYEALTLSEAYAFGAEIIEFDPQIKEYYWQQHAMPETIQKLMVAQPVTENKLNWYQTEVFDVYVYPHKLKTPDQTLWVVHYFAKDDLGDTFYFSRNLAITFTLVFVALLLMAVMVLSMSIGRQMKDFAAWIADSRLKSEAILPPNFDFDELQYAAFTLAKSIELERRLQLEQQEQVEREKAFLSTLSHELRTPMAVINAAIALLVKRRELSAKDGKTLAKLGSANDKMKLLSTTLLALWRKLPSDNPQTQVDIGNMINQSIVACEQLSELTVKVELNGQAVENLKLQSGLLISANGPLLQLIFDNVLRNVAQYSADAQAQLNLTISDNTLQNLIIVNACQNGPESDASEQYGFGLGLFLVAEICQQYNWPLHADYHNGYFTVSIDFSRH